MPVDKPDWVTAELIQDFMQWSKDHASRHRYIMNASRFYGRYTGETSLAPIEGYDDMELDERHARNRRNVIGETVDEISSLFLKNKPIIRRWPYIAEHAGLSDDLDAMFLWAWDAAHGQQNLRSLLEDAEITGMGAMKIMWDPRSLSPDRPGRIVMQVIPGSSLYVDPLASNTQRGRDVRWIVHHTRKLPEEIVARYGYEAEVALGWRDPRGRKSGKRRVYDMLSMTRQELNRRLTGEGVQESLDSDDELRKDVYEAWIFPHTMYGAELATADKPPKEEYPFGLVATMVEDQIIRCKPNPFVKGKTAEVWTRRGMRESKRVKIGPRRHPFVFLWWKRTADTQGNRRFYDCMGMVEWMVSLQFNVDALRTNIAQNARTISNPPIAYSEDALATPPEDIVFAPTQLLRVRARYNLDEAIKVLAPGAMPEQVLRLVQEDILAMKELAGVKPGMIGMFPPPRGGTSHTPPATVGLFQESAFGAMWRYTDELGEALIDMGYFFDTLAQLKYEPGHYMATTRGGQQTMVDWTEEHALAQFRREVVAGATTPLYDIEKQQREAQVVELTNLAIDSSDPRKLRVAIIYLQSLNFPWAYQYIEVLQEEMQRLSQMTQGLAAFGAGEMTRQQEALPPAAGAGQNGVGMLAEEMGVPEDQLLAHLQGG